MRNTLKPCPLRKVCEECKKEYGRKIQVSGAGQGCYQSVKNFESSHTCSRSCACKRKARIQREDREKRARAKAISDARLARVMQQFLYPAPGAKS